MIAKNIAWNALGGGMAMALSVLAVPIQSALLGMSAFGVVGFIATLQVAISLLDFGLTTVAIRASTSQNPPSADLLRTVSTLSWTIATAAALAGAALALPICDLWLRPPPVLRDQAMLALFVALPALALRLPATCQAGILAGHHRLDQVNLLRAGCAVFRHGGTVAVLALLPSLSAFACWLAISALIELVAHAVAVRRLRRDLGWRLSFDRRCIAWAWGAGGGVSLLAIQSAVITQSDRWILARTGDLHDLGLYSTAYQLTLGMSMAQGFVTAALVPSFADRSQDPQLVKRRLCGTQAIAVALAPVAATGICFAEPVLAVVLPAPDAAPVAACISVLAVGFLLNAAPSVLVAEAIARGSVRAPLIANWILLVPYLITLWAAASWAGPIGAAWVWVGLNAAYLVLLPPIIARVSGILDAGRIILGGSLPFWCTAAVAFALVHAIVPDGSAIWAITAASIATILHLALAWHFLDPELRRSITNRLSECHARP